MDGNQNKHPSVGKSFEIDQQAIKVFFNWLPNNWLLRDLKPDFHVDYLVEIVEGGEPTGKLFGVQLKGFEDDSISPKPLSYAFKTKHLNYYLNRSQYPVFLLLVNVTSREGFWVFAQKLLKDVPKKKLEVQKSLTVHFASDDNLTNFTKFKYLLPEAEQFVRDLHPGSPLAAVHKRKTDLELLDPRCTVEVGVSKGHEHIVIHPKQMFPFSLKITTENVSGWRDFFEKGEIVKAKSGEIEFIGMPIFEDLLKRADEIHLQVANKCRAAINIASCNDAFPSLISIAGEFVGGSKYSRFTGELRKSPLAVTFQISREEFETCRSVDMSVEFSLSKWSGFPLLDLPNFDQVKRFADSFSGKENPKVEVLIDGNRAVYGDLGGRETPITMFIQDCMDWLVKCRWLAEHFNVNPVFPKLDGISFEQFRNYSDIHDVIRYGKMVWPRPHTELSIPVQGMIAEDIQRADSAMSLRLESKTAEYDFWGTLVKLPATEHIFSEVNLESRTPIDEGKAQLLVFKGNEKTMQFSSLIS